MSGFVRLLLIFIKEVQPVIQPHGHKPRLTAAAVEYGGRAIVKAIGIPGGLLYGLRYVQSLTALALDMDTRQAGQVRDFSIALSPPGFYIVATGLEDVGKLQLRRAALSL